MHSSTNTNTTHHFTNATKHSYDCALLPLIEVAYIRDTPADSMDESRHRANMSNVSYMNPLVYHAIYLPQIYSDTIIM